MRFAAAGEAGATSGVEGVTGAEGGMTGGTDAADAEGVTGVEGATPDEADAAGGEGAAGGAGGHAARLGFQAALFVDSFARVSVITCQSGMEASFRKPVRSGRRSISEAMTAYSVLIC